MMKRSVKKAIAFMLALVFALQLVAIDATSQVKAANNLSDFDISEDGTTIYGYAGTEENVVIPDGVNSIYIYYDEVIKTIEIPNSVHTLVLCSDTLETITVPSSISYLSLSGCYSLKQIDFSKKNQSEGYYSIWDTPVLETINFGNISGSFYIQDAAALKTLDCSKSKLTYIGVYDCDNLTNISFNKSAEGIGLHRLKSLQKAVIPENADIYISGLNFDSVIVKNNKRGYSVKDGGLYYTTSNGDGDQVKSLVAIDTNRETINVAKGTHVIENLCLSGTSYKTTIINLPDSVEKISDYAFEGGDKLQKLSIPKNCISINSYAFSGLNSDIELTIPASIRYLREDAFAGFKGKVKLEKETEALSEYEDGIYYNESYSYADETYSYSTLVYYPYDKATITFSPDITNIGQAVFMDTTAKTLNIPEGVYYFNLILSNAYNLKTLTLPSTIGYADSNLLKRAPALTKFTVSPDNQRYTSYKNCLYDKEMVTLLDVPGALTKIEIPEGVLSLGYYTIYPHYVQTADGEKYITQDVSFPKSIINFEEFNFNSATCYADTPIAEAIQSINEEYKYWGEEYGYTPTLLNYKLKDTNKELLNMIYVVDTVTVNKGEKASAAAEMPSGVYAVSKLTLGNNTECQVKYSSSDKKIAKVNSKTGEITGVKKGTCTINVKCTITNGKKKNSKTFKVKVKVK